MIKETIAKIEERLLRTKAINDENKSELLNFLSTLKTEVSEGNIYEESNVLWH